MSITVTVKDHTPELFGKLDLAVRRFVVKAAAYIEGQVKSSMAEPKSGHTYGTHRASAPGESPAIDSSNLIGSIQKIIEKNGLMARIGTPVEYAAWLEDGTSRMEARPVWEVERMESLPTLEKMLREEVSGQ